ncbi:MAG: MgtC/SapB family protein, partial [Methylocystis sp.]
MYELSVEGLIWRLSVAFAIGLLIGLERGWQARAEAEGERAAGLRTFALTALLGGAWGAIVLPFGDFAAVGLAIIFIGVCVVIALFRLRQIEHDHTYGATTIVAIMLAFSLGVMAVIGHETPAVAAAVATTAMLASKNALHNWLQKLTWPELRSALALLVMSFILLPILPNHPVDRFGAINPFALWLMTVLIAVISFAGYVAVRVIGYQKGLAVAGLAGGLASSTATTAAMARLAIKYPLQGKALAGAAALANAIMAFRVLIILAVINLTLALQLAAPLIVIGLVYGACGMLLTRYPVRDEHAASESLIFENPLDIAAVLKFGALLSAVMIVS